MTHHLRDEDFDALLADTASEPIRAHLATCPTCAQAWQDVARGHAFLRQARPIPAPLGFHDRVMAALAAAPSPAPWGISPRARRWLFVALLVSCLAGGGLLASAVVLFLEGWRLTPILGVAMQVARVGLRFALNLTDVLLTVVEILALTPWGAALVFTALLLGLLALWTTRFYSRRLFVA